jgi:hypothetical protein
MPENQPEGKDRVIDFAASKTETEWAFAAQSFFEAFTHQWFKWIGWIFAIGGIAYIAAKTGSVVLKVLEQISFVLLWFYFMYFFASLRIQPYYKWARSRPSQLKRALALIPMLFLALVLTLGVRALISHVIEQIQIAK